MQETKQEVSRVVSLVNDGRNLRSVSNPVKFIVHILLEDICLYMM